MNNRTAVIALALVLGVGLGLLFHQFEGTTKLEPIAAIGDLPGRHLQTPWWEAVKGTQTPTLSTYVVPADVLFSSGSAVIDSQGKNVLARLIPQLRVARSVTVAGCTDAVGGARSPYNFALGRQRAQSAVTVLEADGLPASLFQVTSWADTHPVSHTAGLDATTINALNRRIVVIVTKW